MNIFDKILNKLDGNSISGLTPELKGLFLSTIISIFLFFVSANQIELVPNKNESYKSELTSQSYHVMRFIVRVEFNRSESDNQTDAESAIEYPSEIKFKIK